MKTPLELAELLNRLAYEYAMQAGLLLELSVAIRRENRAPTLDEIVKLFASDPFIQEKFSAGGMANPF